LIEIIEIANDRSSVNEIHLSVTQVIERGYDERCFNVKNVKGEMRKSQLLRFGAAKAREFLSNSRDEAI